MSVTAPPISPPLDVQLVEPDYHVIATHIANARGTAIAGGFPSALDLAEAISDVAYNAAMPCPSLVVTLLDPGWAIMDSGIFDADQDSHMDAIDVNYPDGSRYWWRCTQVNPVGSAQTLTLTFMTREAVFLMHLHGPYKANRASMTRAEFLKHLCDQVTEGDGIDFYSKELDLKEPLAQLQAVKPLGRHASSLQVAARSAAKKPGIGANSQGLTIKGQAITPQQITDINTALQVAWQLKAPPAAVEAMVFAGIAETGWARVTNASGHKGIWQSTSYDPNDVAGAAKGFLTGGPSFGGGGAIAQARSSSDPIAIAQAVEVGGSYAGEAGYPTFLPEARAIIAKGGGGVLQGGGGVQGGASSSTVTTIEAYFYEVNPTETYWDAINRLAKEVNWDFFLDGNLAYFDSEIVLAQQQVAAVIARDDENVADWTYNWDARAIFNQMTLTVFAEMFEFQVGTVLQLERFGTASTASTAKLPGRWIIDSFTRNKSDIVTVLTLKQPAKPKLEPAPLLKTTSVSGGVGGAAGVGGGFASTGIGSQAGIGGGGATNPAPGAVWGRLDMGFDGNYGHLGCVAPFNGTIRGIGITGWPGQGVYFAILNDDQSGPDYTRAMYFAEGATPIYPNGTHVKRGQKIGNPVASGGTGAPGNFEIGPANTSNFDCLAKSYGLSSSASRAMILKFYAWMRSIGAGASNNPSAAGGP